MKKILLLALTILCFSCSNSDNATSIDCNSVITSDNVPQFNTFRISFYDSDGIVTATQDYVLDSENRMISMQQLNQGSGLDIDVTFNYNDCGLLTSMDRTLTDREYTLEYDGAGRITEYKVTQGGGFKYTFEYLSQTEVLIKEWRVFNEQTNDFTTVNNEFTYMLNQEGQVIRTTIATNNTTNAGAITTFQYDGNGNILREEKNISNMSRVKDFAYGNVDNPYFHVFEKMYGRRNLYIMWDLPVFQHIDLRTARSKTLYSTFMAEQLFPSRRSITVDETQQGYAKVYQVFVQDLLTYEFSFNF